MFGCLDDLDYRQGYLVQLYDVGMPNQLQNMNLSADSLHIGNIYDSLFLEDLDGNFLAGEGMGPHLDLAEGSLSDCLSDQIVAYFLVICS